MPIYSVQGPDGRIYDVEGPAGASEAAILNVVRRQIALETLRGGQPQEAAPESGFLPSLKSSASELKAGIAALAGRTGIMDQAAAEKYIKEQEEYQRKTFKPTETFGEAPITKTLELLGGSLPYVAAPVAAGAAAATLPLTGTAATVAGLGAAGLASATQFTGSNLRSQMGTGKTLGETDVQAAALASIPQAALDALSFKMIPGIRNVLTAAGKEVTPKAAKAIAEQSIREAVKDYAVSTGKAMGTEGLTEVGQQVLERMQAGLNITDEQARSEYYDSLIGGAVLGGVLSPAGRYMERRGEARKEEETALQKALADRAKEEKAKAEEKASPDYALRFVQDYDARLARFQELKKIEKPGSDATPDERVAFDEVKKERNALNKSLTQDSKEYREAKKVAEQLLEQQRREQMSPEAFMLEQMGIKETPVEEAAPPAMRTVVDEMGRITEVPVDQAEAPSAAEQYATQQIETARSAGLLTLPDLREYLMSDPALARQVVDERVALPGMTRKESNALLDSMNSEFRAQDKRAKELEKGAAKEAEARQENIRAAMAGQAPGAELMGAARKMPGVQAAAQERVAEEARQAKVRPEVEALQRIAARPVTGMDQFDLSGIAPPAAGEPAPAVRPTDTAADVRNQIEDLFKQVEKAQQEATTARAAGESAAATAAQARAEEALNSLNRIQGMSGESSAYATNMVQLRKAQEKGLFDLQESLDNIRRGAYLGGPASEEGTTTRALLQNKVDQQRADVINNVLKEAALHRRALGRPDLTTDETVAAADKLNTVLEEAITRMQSTPQKEEVVTVPAQMRGTQVVRGAETEMRDTRPLEERPLRAPVAAFKVFNEQVREIRDQLIGEAAPAVRQEPVLRQQFQTSEAAKVAEARGETATTLGGELRRRTEYVRDMMAKMQTMRPMARDVLNQAADVMDSGRATRELLDTVEPVVSAINTGKQITQTDLRAIKDSLAVISRAAQEGETVGKIEGQKDLFTDSTSRALQDRTLGVVRNTAQAFENAPVVKRARMAAEQAQQAAQRVAEQQAKQKVLDAEAQVKKAQDLARRISDTESSVEQQRQELQVELQRAMAEARPAITEHAQLTQDPAVAKAKAALEAAEKALAPLEEQLRPIMESDAPFGDKIKAAAPVYQQQKVVQQAREVFQKALSNSTERANGADVVAAAYRDALVQLEQKTLLKLQKKLDDLKAKASPPPQLTQAQQEIAMQRQRVAAAENAQREANLAADRAKREREQRLANMGGTRVVGGEATPILTPEERVKQAEKARADLTREMADTSIAGRGDIPQTARVTGPVTRSASSAPSAMRTGSAESKAGATSAPVAQGLSESRTPAKSTRPISSEEMQQANKEAAKISATKQPEDVAKAERESEQSAEDFAREEARAAQAEADRLRKKGKKGKPAVYRTTGKGKGVAKDALERLLKRVTEGWKTMPTTKVVQTFDELPAHIKEQAIEDGVQDVLPGLYDPDTKTVYLVADNTHNAADAVATIAHEITGHFGLREMLGGDYTSMMDSLYNGNKSVRQKADAKLKDGKLSRQVAVEEVLAEMAEADPNAEAKGVLRRVYDIVIAALKRLTGQTISDKAVQQVVANARNFVIEGGTAKAGNVDTSGALYRVRPKYKNNDMAGIGQDIRKVVAQQKSWADKIKANSSGLAFETALVDRFAGFERLKKYMEPLKGSQMMYYLRMYDQRMNFVSQSVGNGALERVAKKRADGQTEYVIESKEGANIANVVKILKGANKHVGNAEAVNQMFTTYLAALRAKRVGLSTLDFGGTITQDMLNRVEAAVEGNADLKDIFNKARDEYNAYNRNLLKFVAESGALSKDLVNKLSRTNDYIPFYREQNGAAMLFIAGESPIRIGSIAEQPYLKELVGGDQPILDFMTSAVQNTNMLVDMALRNIATKNAVFELVDLNAAKLMKKAEGPDVVTFKIDGKDMHAVLDTESVSIGGRTFSTGVPADLLVKGMEGIPTQMPTLFRVMAMPAQLLRKAVTLSPMYMAKQLFRDSLAAPMIAGANFTPVLGALRQINGTAKKTLEQRGITGGQQFQGTTEDLSKILRDIADGKPGWMTALGKVEALGMEADALTRRAQYNSYIEQGMSEMEATLLSLESMNFNKRGASPSVHVANAMIPFFNAQIQGLNVMYKALTGQLPFNDKIKMRQKLLVRGGMMAVATLLYAALMEDDETYQNATPDQKYANWFVRVPGVEEAVRVPIPFEIGYVFKALPEALYNSMRGKEDSKDAAEAFRQILLQSVPGGSSYFSPQIAKPAIEAALGKSFYTGRDILSAREKELMPEEQFRANTSEVAKAVGRNLGISPVVMENLVRGYTGTMGLAFLHALGVGMSKTESPEAAVKRLSDMPIVGGSFQPNNAGNIVNNAYERFNEDISIRNSYKKMVSEGRTAEANSLLQRRSNEIMEAELGDIFKSNMNKLTQAERAIAASRATPQEKRQQLDEIRRLKTMIARSMRDAAEKTKPQ